MVVDAGDLTPNPFPSWEGEQEKRIVSSYPPNPPFHGGKGERIVGRGTIGDGFLENVCLAALWLGSGIVHFGLCCV